MIAARAGVAATLLTLCVHAQAQTVDPLFAGVRWAPRPPGSRPAGMGNAFAAVADSGKALYFNPAGLAQIPKQELELSFADPWLSGGVRIGPVRLGAYGTRSRSSDDVAPGALDARFSEWGVGLGIAPLHRLRLGVAAAWSGVEMAGRRSVTGTDGQETVLAEVSGEDRELRLSFGALFTVYTKDVRGLPSLRVGAAYQRGFDWQAQLLEPGAAGVQSRTITVRRPSVLTAGLAFYGTGQWSLFAQGDVIRYGEVMAAVRANSGSAARSFELVDVIEPRVGSELAIPLTCGCGTVKLRGGLQYVSPGTLVYSGADPELEQLFGVRSWRTVASLGASFFSEYFGKALRFDLDSKDVFEGPALSFGVVFRF